MNAGIRRNAILSPTHQGTRLELFDLKGSLPLLERFVEFVPDAVVGVRKTGTIMFVNARAEQLFGYEGGELVGRSVETLVPERLREPHREQRAGYHESPRIRAMGAGLDLRGLRADGSEFPADISLSIIESGHDVLALAFIRDLSDRGDALANEGPAGNGNGNRNGNRNGGGGGVNPDSGG